MVICVFCVCERHRCEHCVCLRASCVFVSVVCVCACFFLLMAIEFGWPNLNQWLNRVQGFSVLGFCCGHLHFLCL